MKTAKLLFVLLTLLIVAADAGFAQTDSLVDVFPLTVGNQWVYNYYTYWAFFQGGQIIHIVAGQVSFTVASIQAAADSVNWILARYRNLSGIGDSALFILTEHLTGAHQLLCNGCEGYYPDGFAFPFGSAINRYMRVDPNGYAYVGDLTLRQNVGEVRYYFDHAGNPRTIANTNLLSSVITSVNEQNPPTAAKEFALDQNYPNPFNPSTKIRFSLPSQETNIAKGRAGEGSHLTLKVFDVLGREVATLVNEELKPGSYERTFNAAGLASGVYFYRLQAGSYQETKKLLLLR